MRQFSPFNSNTLTAAQYIDFLIKVMEETESEKTLNFAKEHIDALTSQLDYLENCFALDPYESYGSL